jgi:hypothetical protein
MVKGISEIVGEADGADGSRVRVYRALRQLLCAACGGTIREGGLFIRRTLPGYGMQLLPRCRGCEPFTPPGDAGLHLALIESLFTPPAQEAETEVRRPTRREELDEAVMKRLGPALSRSRKGK